MYTGKILYNNVNMDVLGLNILNPYTSMDISVQYFEPLHINEYFVFNISTLPVLLTMHYHMNIVPEQCRNLMIIRKCEYLKVLIINDYAAVVGGAERFLENLMYESENAGIEFHRLDIADVFKEGGPAPKSNFITGRYRRIRIIPEIVRYITNRIERIKPDLIHLNNNHLYTNSVIHSIKASGIPVLWFVHDHYTLRRLQSAFYLPTKDDFTFLTHSPEIYKILLTMDRNAYLVRVPFNHAKWTKPQADKCGPSTC